MKKAKSAILAAKLASKQKPDLGITTSTPKQDGSDLLSATSLSGEEIEKARMIAPGKISGADKIEAQEEMPTANKAYSPISEYLKKRKGGY